MRRGRDGTTLFSARAAVLLAATTACAIAAHLAGCTNDPFDPSTVLNSRPVARIFVTPYPGGELSPTSYYERTFHWSGSDEDGFVIEYYVSIETATGVAAPWAATQRTDTTMTFTTDDLGEAQALIRVACRDDDGAVSDTVSQFIPLRNFPPVINFTADYDTVTWSYGAANFRFFALDLDGNVTMDDSVVYFLDTADTNLAPALLGEPDADPNLRPVIKRLDDVDAGLFSVDLRHIQEAGSRTLNVRIGDEAHATTNFSWTWNVLPALSPVLLVDDILGNIDVPFYHGSMDSIFGAGQWSRYDLSAGLPDRTWVMLETFRQFEAVFWYTGISTSANLGAVAVELQRYLYEPPPDHEPGRLLLISKGVIGGTLSLPPSFVQNTLGISRTPSQPTFYIPQDKTCFAAPPGRLPDLHFSNGFSAGIGLTPMA
ncbi:hypothetical protein KKA85_15285, partial [bacterium]|nr:hypothetical protein [bacterium]